MQLPEQQYIEMSCKVRVDVNRLGDIHMFAEKNIYVPGLGVTEICCSL